MLMAICRCCFRPMAWGPGAQLPLLRVTAYAHIANTVKAEREKKKGARQRSRFRLETAPRTKTLLRQRQYWYLSVVATEEEHYTAFLPATPATYKQQYRFSSSGQHLQCPPEEALPPTPTTGALGARR